MWSQVRAKPHGLAFECLSVLLRCLVKMEAPAYLLLTPEVGGGSPPLLPLQAPRGC